ncbi:hypothetical protein [Heliorestis convoluta]|uniref:DUF4276 family protein n=1 Tax=Heliorestis convoluta TaxID=356322 RepID=A0A5Q2N5I3_9FIRM|nr:hypothetical protein [Heliorestis convoluta]QGG47500.1 hypothetical protein FTV88_1353 [Heliorestis convoluta]
MNVLIIPEDFRKDQYILQPIINAMFEGMGKKAKIRVCQEPLLGGISQATKTENIAKILKKYKGMVDLFLLCVDRDGKQHRKQRLEELEHFASTLLAEKAFFIAENAWQELEVWILAGHTMPSQWRWKDIRNETNPKEMYYLPFAKQCKLLDSPGEGRKILAAEAARNYNRIAKLCPEDIGALENRIRAVI